MAQNTIKLKIKTNWKD